MKREIIDKTGEIKTLFINNFLHLIYLDYWPIFLAQDLYPYNVFETILHHAHAAWPNSLPFVSRSHLRSLLCQKPPAPTEARTPDSYSSILPPPSLHNLNKLSSPCQHILVHTSGRNLLSYKKPDQHPKSQSTLGQIRGHTYNQNSSPQFRQLPDVPEAI